MGKSADKIVSWLRTVKILAIPRRYVGRALNHYYASRGFMLVPVDDYGRQAPDAFNLIRQINNETEMRLIELEAYRIYSTVRKAEKIPGEIAEVGVYQGDRRN